MLRRLLQLVALAAAVAAAIAVGTAVRQHRAGPGPVAVARQATTAYAAGDCQALRKVSFDPGVVDCRDVSGVRDAYRAEGLRPDTFRYELVARDELVASVRIAYRREGKPAEEIVRLQRRDDDWLVVATPIGAS